MICLSTLNSAKKPRDSAKKPRGIDRGSFFMTGIGLQ